MSNHGKKFQKPTPDAVKRLIWLILVTLAVFLFYRVMMNFYYFEIVMIAYMVATVAFVLSYVIYNKGFSRRGVTREMLPDDWSEEQKNEFFEDGKNRQARSRWLLIPIFAFVFTFAIDAMELFVLPFFSGLFSK
ncbi:MAG: hypothetical protein J6Q82_07805 [Clostridia bacterium]|nr:hypothetical protein [Clostridia bacterium]